MTRILTLFAALLPVLCVVPAQEPVPGSDDVSPSLNRIDARTPQGLRDLLRPSSGPLRFVSAHRGGARKGYPENCLETFEDTLRQTGAIMEIDPRYAKDGSIVLHHDESLERTTNGRGKVSDLTLPELKQLRLKDPEGNLTGYRIPTLDEALEWARGRTVFASPRRGAAFI